MKSIYVLFDKDTHYLGRLTNLRQTSIVIDFILAFEQLPIHTKGLIDSFYMECFISGVKEEVRTQVSV